MFKQIESTEPLVYDTLQQLIEQTFKEEEETNNNITSYENKIKYYFRIVKEKIKNFYKQGIIAILFGLFFFNILIQVVNYIKFLLVLDTQYIINRLYPIYAIIPFAIWIWSTAYDYYNFWNRKIRLIKLCIIHMFVITLNFLGGIIGELVLWFWSMAPRDEQVTISLLCGLSRITMIIILPIPLIIFCFYILREIDNKLTRQAVIRFKIKKILSQIKPSNTYAYDLKIVKNLETGRTHTIHEKDRFTHAVGNGVTGTGKTSSTFIPAIESDLEQIVHNKECQKKKCMKMLQQGKLRLKYPISDIDFNIDVFEGTTPDYQKELDAIKMNIKVAGITAIAPDASFADEVYSMAHVKGLKVNRIDPVLTENNHLKPGFIGFNPLYITPGLNQIEFIIEAARKSIMWADVTQAIYDSEGMSDPYFASLNKQTNSTCAMLLIFTFPAVDGRQPNPTDVQLLLSDFKRAKVYRDKLIELYSKKDEYNRMEIKDGKPKMILPIFQTILDVVDNELLGAGAEKMNDQCRGLRNIINSFLADLHVQNIFSYEKSVDIERAFENGEITVVNFALELGTSGKALGLFYLLSMIQAAYRRKGNENTRIPNFCYIDEFPQLLHPSAEQCFVLFRKYKIGMFIAIQSLSQMDKNRSTAFLKPVILGNCAHHFVFGRAATEEMQYYEMLAGVYEKQNMIESINETSLIADNPSISYQHRIQPQMENRIEGGEIHDRDFQEVTVVTVDEGNPVATFFGKLSFIPRYKNKIQLNKKTFDWMEYYIPDEENIKKEEKKEIMGSLISASTNITSADSFDVKTKKEESVPAFVHSIQEKKHVEYKEDSDISNMKSENDKNNEHDIGKSDDDEELHLYV